MTPRSEITYGQHDKVLRQLGLSCRLVKKDVKSRLYEHEATGALVLLPTFPKNSRVPEYHIVGVRVTLDEFGIADPSVLEAKLQKAV